ncbi:hypothetical protein B0O80DRAFT_504680 [Mortierella sp. GBAus27b]|nr:hypothetical protein B0O80DRAFT_504680 [Mortierella sp. GBAus27b]
MSRLFNREQEAQGTPVMPGPFDTDDAQRAVTASMESIKKEMDIITGKRQYQDNYEKTVLNARKRLIDDVQGVKNIVDAVFSSPRRDLQPSEPVGGGSSALPRESDAKVWPRAETDDEDEETERLKDNRPETILAANTTQAEGKEAKAEGSSKPKRAKRGRPSKKDIAEKEKKAKETEEAKQAVQAVEVKEASQDESE